MENSNTILNELKEISAVVAGIGQQQPYTVPEGYFDSLPMQLMLRIGLEEKAGADPVLNISKDNVYQAPAGYFDNLAGNILKRVKEEEASADPVVNITKDNAYQAPAGYFDGLAGNILNRIKEEEDGQHLQEPDLSSALWQQLGKKNPFTIPEGYFNEFSDNIVAGAKAIAFVNEALENLSPLMTSLKTKQVYEVPNGYFEANAAAILKKLNEQPVGKVISVGFGRKMMRYAAAAVVAGVLLVAGYMYTGNTKPAVPTAGDVPGELAKASDQEIENFLNNNTASVADTSTIVTADDEMSDKDSKDLLANISDEELQHYLEQYGSNPNAITN
jgi:hypothetical protein